MKEYVQIALSTLTAVFVVSLALLCAFCLMATLRKRVARVYRERISAALWQMRRATLVVLSVMAVVVTIKAQKRGSTGTTGGTTMTTGNSTVAGSIADTLHFEAITAHTNDTSTLSVSWPPDSLTLGTMLDLLSTTSLVNSAWAWQLSHVVADGETNWIVTTTNNGANSRFFKVVVRNSLVDMNDPDRDGLPNVYELANGTNPWVDDYALAPRIFAGGTNENSVANLASAFAASEDYSIIEVAEGTHSGNGWTGLHLPAHPVLVTSPGGGRFHTATLRHTDQNAAFYLSATQRTDTVIQGLNIDLVGTSGRQIGFWCGGELPWSGPPAAGTFKNISLRMSNPDVQYFGWFFRHWESNEVVIAACTLNALGSTNVRGIYAIDSPPMSVENCTFANFPLGDEVTPGYAIQYETTEANLGNAPDTIPLEIVNCLFDVSFTNSYVLAPLMLGVTYDVTMANCIVPSPLTYLPDHEYGMIITNALTTWSGHLMPNSPAIDAGVEALYSSFDLDGQPRDNHPDIGADEYVPDPAHDADNDGLTDAYEIQNGTDPYRADTDYDWIQDGLEVAEQTDPNDRLNFCFACTATIGNTSAVYTNSCCAYLIGQEMPPAVTSFVGSATIDLPHVIVTNGVVPSLVAWIDVNANGTWETGEPRITKPLTVTNHELSVSIDLVVTNGDTDHDLMPNVWEVLHGLCPTNNADAYDDPDNDGLINLHEFWAGTNPLMPDGSNTLLSVAARSIDDRIRDVDPAISISRFTDFDPKAAVNLFTLNTNFWARDLDLSCVSVWNNGSYPETQAATLITRKHVVMANHWFNRGTYTFCDTNGLICVRSLVRSWKISDDLQLGQLDVDLPDSFTPASVMSTNFVRYLSFGKYLPTLCLNQEKGATVLELEDLNCRVLEDGGIWHNQYGLNNITNRVSMQRSNIRGVTPGGNSGCPVFLVIGKELVLLFSKHLGSHTEDRWCYFSGPMLPFRLEAIQWKIDEWEGADAGQYQLVPFDLSTYPELVNQQ